MYGTQDASHIWQEDHVALLKANGYRQGLSNGAVFYNEAEDTRCLVHGDDLLVLGPQASLDKF